jgi:Zn-finger protein
MSRELKIHIASAGGGFGNCGAYPNHPGRLLRADLVNLNPGALISCKSCLKIHQSNVYNSRSTMSAESIDLIIDVCDKLTELYHERLLTQDHVDAMRIIAEQLGIRPKVLT